MWLVIGLGNPGPNYSNTRHNVGFKAVDALIRRFSFGASKQKWQADYAEGTIEGERVLAIKPLTYMNLSGNAVREFVQFYKIPLDHIIVIHDDLDVAVGRVKIKVGGGHGGHNGLRSLDAQIGKEYKRVRLGIGHPGDRNLVSDYVLSNFNKADEQAVEECIDRLVPYFPLILQGQDALCLTRVAM